MTDDRVPGVPIGRRVVVRYLIEDGARATDALGILVAQDEGGLDIETKHGVVRVPRGSVVATKLVPPAPPRRRHTRRSG
ncbi:MAG: hypothetical protein ACR2FV_02160 [Ornithinimicrobium sp.]|jgi:hypothetical protein|uniref:putative acetyltransferase n=1 Tax=Ornithinimicrobium sp. TaxID=1977084 RepID=UPI00182A25D9|nr:ferrous iron transport protein A [Actinomycetota bacterium]